MTSFYSFVLMEYAKMSYFATHDYIGVVSIQAEKNL